MKKFKIVYFLPVIIYLLIIALTLISDTLYFTDYSKVILSMAAMVVAAVTLCQGKMWGAVLAVIFYGVWSIWDYYMVYLPWFESRPVDTVVIHSILPAYYICVPVMIYYLFCIIDAISRERKR